MTTKRKKDTVTVGVRLEGQTLDFYLRVAKGAGVDIGVVLAVVIAIHMVPRMDK